ncbi:MAG: ATP synthase F0 subunit B [Sphingobacteriaceae bacterium]|nr:ATP synthase F0 subunit B [Sphingobacteriaceae bacterium]
MNLITPEIGLIFWTGITFLILLFLLRKFAWKPILGAVEERDNKINAALNAAEEARKEIANLAAENEKLLNEARAEKDRIIADAKKTRETMISEAKAIADSEAKRMIETARASIENEKNAALTEVKNLVAGLSIDIAEKLLRKQFENNAEQQAFVKKHIEDIKLN